MPPTPEKHLPYFEVLDALKSADACVICWRLKKATHAHIEGLLYESVTDRGITGQLRQSHGYCPRHAELLIASGDALGVGLLHRPLLIAWREHLESIPMDPPYRFLGQAREPEWSGTANCPLCLEEQALAERTADTIAKWMAEKAMATAMDAAPLFCPSHFHAILLRCTVPAERRAYLTSERRKIAELHEELEKLISSFIHEKSAHPLDREKESWIRTARLIAHSKRPPAA